MPIDYTGRPEEKAALEDFCRSHLTDFWPYAEFALSLKIPQTFLLFDLDGRGQWTSLALGRVISGIAELYFIFVHPDYRRRGLAGLMLVAFEEYAIRMFQAQSFYLEVRRGNLGAIALYEGLGYERIAERKRYYPDGEDALIYQKLGKA